MAELCYTCASTRKEREAAMQQMVDAAVRWWQEFIVEADMQPEEIEFHRATIRRALDGAEKRARALKPCLELAPAIAS